MVRRPLSDAHNAPGPVPQRMKGDHTMSMNEIEAKCRELRQLQNLIAEAEQEAEAIKDALKVHMGDNEELYAGEYMVTWRPVKSSRVDTAALRVSTPRVSTESPYRYCGNGPPV